MKEPSNRSEIDLKTLAQTGPYEWPSDSDETILRALRNDRADDHDRLFAIEVAGYSVGVNDDLAEALLSVLDDSSEPEPLREQAAGSLGPTLEYAEEQGFSEFSDATISENTFEKIQRSLQTCFGDTGSPKAVRRRALEASIRSPQKWHREAIGLLYASGDEDWKLTAVFCMRWLGGFEEEILEALGSENRAIQREALAAFGELDFDGAGLDLDAAMEAEDVKTGLAQAVVSYINGLPPEQAETLLASIAMAGDDENSEAVGEDVTTLDMDFSESASAWESAGSVEPDAETGPWARLDEDSSPMFDEDSDLLVDTVDDSDWFESPKTIRRTTPKVGRNERCPCGSGKKYKKCCGA